MNQLSEQWDVAWSDLDTPFETFVQLRKKMELYGVPFNNTLESFLEQRKIRLFLRERYRTPLTAINSTLVERRAKLKEIDMMSQWRGSWYSTKINYLTPTTPESSNRNAPTSHAGPVKDQVSFIDELRKETNGMINIGSVINQPFLSVKGTQANIVKLNNADIQIYEYDSNNLMSNEAKQISSDGSSVKTASGSITQIDWNSTPHFYSTGRIMVIYIGTDSQVINILTNILGTQFAGK